MIIKYLLTTPKHLRQKDWQEFKQLKQQIKDARMAVGAARENITEHNISPEFMSETTVCFTEEIKIDTYNGLQTYEGVCSFFYHCKQSNCPSYKAHNKYTWAQIELQNLEHHKKHFFTKKLKSRGQIKC